MENNQKLTLTEEDYLKTIYHLSQKTPNLDVTTNDIAKSIDLSAASVSDMLKKLSNKGLIHYIKYQGVRLTTDGHKIALYLIRKHRLWETFLCQKLNFQWDEVHEIAEQLEHINSSILIERLDEFLNYPAFDPHGDPIPNAEGNILDRPTELTLLHAPLMKKIIVVAVKENTPVFLKMLNKLNIHINTRIEIKAKNEFDHSIEIVLNDLQHHTLSKEVAENIFVKSL
ncbi:MAG: metal-dependent transcriptional regulator [Cytophagales bacterium]|nr:MAG: metal-dependent transcriptional regulator [Cytophagales bacterium]